MVIQLHKQDAFGKGKILTTAKRDIPLSSFVANLGDIIV